MKHNYSLKQIFDYIVSQENPEWSDLELLSSALAGDAEGAELWELSEALSESGKFDDLPKATKEVLRPLSNYDPQFSTGERGLARKTRKAMQSAATGMELGIPRYQPTGYQEKVLDLVNNGKLSMSKLQDMYARYQRGESPGTYGAYADAFQIYRQKSDEDARMYAEGMAKARERLNAMYGQPTAASEAVPQVPATAPPTPVAETPTPALVDELAEAASSIPASRGIVPTGNVRTLREATPTVGYSHAQSPLGSMVSDRRKVLQAAPDHNVGTVLPAAVEPNPKSLKAAQQALTNLNLPYANNPEYVPSQSPYMFGASADSRAQAMAQMAANADPVAAKNAARLQKYERRHPVTGLTNDSLVKTQGTPHTPRTLFGITPSTAVATAAQSTPLEAPATLSSAPTSEPTVPTDTVLQELTGTAPSNPAQAAPSDPASLGARIKRGRPRTIREPVTEQELTSQLAQASIENQPAEALAEALAQSAPEAPASVAETPTPQLVQELSTPTPVLDPKPVSELADDIPGASALKGGTKRTPTFNPAGKAARQTTQESSRQATVDISRIAAERPAPDGLKGLHANLTGGVTNPIGDGAVKGMKNIASKQGAELLKNATPTPKKGLAGLFGSKGNNTLSELNGPTLTYDKGKGVFVNGSNTLGNLGAIASFATGALSGLNGLRESADEGRRTDELSSDVILAAAADPMSTAGLTTSQLKTLGDVRSGRFSSDPDLGDIDWGGALSGGLTGALTGAAGGIPGAIAGGLAGVFGGGMGGFAQARARKNAELEALYQALNQSNAERAAARRRYY